jgi:hypothetical protein
MARLQGSLEQDDCQSMGRFGKFSLPDARFDLHPGRPISCVDFAGLLDTAQLKPCEIASLFPGAVWFGAASSIVLWLAGPLAAQPPPAPPTTSPSIPVAKAVETPAISYSAVHLDGRFIAMTFDDGPSEKLTPELLDISPSTTSTRLFLS